jgi:hypothetical protein
MQLLWRLLENKIEVYAAAAHSVADPDT